MRERRPDRILGPGHDAFWAGCAQGELRLPRCRGCGTLAWPVVAACERCGAGDFAWERLSGHGTLVSWCTFERDYYAGVLPMPWETILVALAEGPLFVSNPSGLAQEDMAIGLPLTVRFIDCEDGAGAFRLPVFTPSAAAPA